MQTESNRNVYVLHTDFILVKLYLIQLSYLCMYECVQVQPLCCNSGAE